MLLQEGAEKQAQLERSLREKAAVEKELEKVRLLQVLSVMVGKCISRHLILIFALNSRPLLSYRLPRLAKPLQLTL